MTIKTLNDDMTNQTLAVEGFKVKVTAVSERSKQDQMVKKNKQLFSPDEFPVDAGDVATPEMISEWELQVKYQMNATKHPM